MSHDQNQPNAEFAEVTSRVIFDSIQQGVWGLNLLGEVTFINKKGVELLGYNHESEIVGQFMHAFAHHSYADGSPHPRELCPMYDSFRNGNVHHVKEDVLWRKEGTSFPVSYFSAPVFIEGICIGSVVTFEDLTETKRLERELEAERLKIMGQAKLASLGEMAGGIAHEINNPLAIISARASNLKRQLERGEIEPEKFLSGLSKIEETVERIAKIIRGLRTFSRNADKDVMVPVAISTIVEDSLELCRERFKNHGIEIKLTGDQDVVIECRSAQIAQIIVNLLGNAFDAVERLNEKWVAIDLSVANGFLKIMVTDSGRGIAREVVEKMMHPFFTTKEIGKGTGLGLSISRGIAEDHHGSLAYNSSSNNTSFILSLPLKQPAHLRDSAAAAPVPLEASNDQSSMVA